MYVVLALPFEPPRLPSSIPSISKLLLMIILIASHSSSLHVSFVARDYKWANRVDTTYLLEISTYWEKCRMSGDAYDRTRKSGARGRRVLLFRKIFRASWGSSTRLRLRTSGTSRVYVPWEISWELHAPCIEFPSITRDNFRYADRRSSWLGWLRWHRAPRFD